MADKGVFSAVVCANKQIGQRFYRLKLEFSGAGAEAFGNSEPGQFAEMDLSSAALPPAERIPEDLLDASERNILLRRPFSFADVAVHGAKTLVDILYCVVGPATLRMTTLATGNSVSLIGPLGNGFRVPDGKKRAILVAGGMGAGPLEHLARILTGDYPGIDAIAFAGAKTVKELPFESQLDKISQQLGFSLPEFAKHGIKSMVATDDGSAGYHGLVSDCLLEWLGKAGLAHDSAIIYACGPEAMLAQVAKIAEEKEIDCQVSMERRMACGFGVCQSCAIECRSDDASENVYKLCCEDGPVFYYSEVAWSIR